MEKAKPTSKEKQELVEQIKHGFRPEDVVVRITPLHKKSITQMVQLYNVPVGQPGHRFVEVNETYRFGYGYREGEDMAWPYAWNSDPLYCDSSIGHGAELDDLCAVDFNFDGDWTDEEMKDFEDKWYNGDPEDNDGRSGLGWIYDYQDTWQIEDEQLLVDGPFKFDVMDKTHYNKIYIENWQPPKEKNEKENKENN